MPHAILIEGAKGSGRREFAMQVAQVILCEGSERPCLVCRHCIKVEKGIHPDITAASGGEGARSFHIDSVREIRASASVRPNEAAARVFLLLDVQNMSVQAQNALLKTIEEPAAGMYFILTCENQHQMLPTIRSRVACISLQLPSVEQCEEYLATAVPGMEPDAYRNAAASAGGNVGVALQTLATGEDGGFQQARKVLIHLLSGEEWEALSALQAFERDRDGFTKFLGMVRAAAAEILTGKLQLAGPVPLPAVVRAIEAIDDITAANALNGNMLLLTTGLCAAIRTVSIHD